MPAKIEFKLDGRLLKQAKGVFENHQFRVGVLQDRPYRKPVSKSKGLAIYAGGPVRRTSRKLSKINVSDVSERLRKIAGNFFTEPFLNPGSREVKALGRTIVGFCLKKKTKKAAETALRNVVVRPILKGAYGTNAPSTVKRKGFNRFMVDTGQFLKAIKAEVTGKPKRV